MNLEDFESYRRFDTRSEALAGFDRIVGRTQRKLQLFDDSGEFWGLERKGFADAVQALLERHRDAAVTVVVHDPGFIERRCARLLALLRRRTPRLQVLRSDPSTRGFSRGIVIADATVVLRRPHFGQPRAFLDFGEAEVGAASALFAELVDGALPGITPSVTGL
ncbi:MAG TPA: hypothetical protein PK177_23645 [Burkholderiaceae bacterium]|nr:hypothetical protein [Burkholderiaceae bacterium]